MASFMTLVLTSFGIAILLNGLASTGPIMATWAGTLKCEEKPEAEKAPCKKDQTWFATLAGVFICFALLITTSSIAVYRNPPARTSYSY